MEEVEVKFGWMLLNRSIYESGIGFDKIIHFVTFYTLKPWVN